MLSALASVTASADDYNMTQPYFYWGEAPFNVSEEAPHNVSDDDGGGTGVPVFPGYIRTTAMVLCLLILGVGVVGNVMVPLVILKSKDMRNSTNIFLLNLSVADLMVLLVCTPTVLVEVNSPPETWVLGQEMCKAVPFVEMTVAHASVLTILAISFERYYAICEPLKAGYVCTKARAMLICLMAWAVAAIFTSPMLFIAEYSTSGVYYDGTLVPVCLTQALTFWPGLYFVAVIVLFFLVPLLVLIVLYAIIAKHLMADPCSTTVKGTDSYNARARKQVVLMLGTVVLSFFVCLIPFRVFTLWIIAVPHESVLRLGPERYYNVLYFCRTVLYLNSAINPILYNLMSSKFRDGFMRLCGVRRRDFSLLGRRRRWINRDDPLNNTMTTSLSYSSTRRYPSHHVDQRASPNFSWRSDSRYSIDSRASIFKNSPERLSRTSSSSRLTNPRLSIDSRTSIFKNSPEKMSSLKKNKSSAFPVSSIPASPLKCSPTLRGKCAVEALPSTPEGDASTSFRKNVMIRSSILNSHRLAEENGATSESYV